MVIHLFCFYLLERNGAFHCTKLYFHFQLDCIIIIIIIIIIIVFIHTDKYTYPMLHFVKIDNYDNTKNN